MPYNIADPSRPIDTLVVRRAEVFREKQDIDLRTGHCVTRIDPAARQVSGTTLQGAPFTVAYDRLLIATGAEAVIPDLPGFDRPGVFALKSLEDGRRIKAFLAQKAVRQAVIIGMGYIALEMVETLHHRGIATAMVKPRPDLLPWLDRELAAMVAEAVGYGGEISWDPSRPDGTPRKLLDVSRLASLGWQARIPLEEGLRRTAADYVRQRESGAEVRL
jgi:NADPH-dependent 2,4-dienoyl-CoA reductase/sulfur reductase-like enzyme